MDPHNFIQKILADSSISPEIKQEAYQVSQSLEKEAKKQAFAVQKLREDKKITANFLNTTVEELEIKNQELLQIAEQKQIANEQLIEINKELEQFAYIISHDLQEPLRTILNFVDLLIKTKKESLDENGQLYLNFISQSSSRLSNLIKAILDYSRIGKTGLKTNINCNELVKEVLEGLSSIIEKKKASIHVSNLPLVYGLKNELYSLFQNLISNALKYSKNDVSIEISITCKPHKGKWLFSIQDNGIGFDTKYHDRIFVIFQRLDNSPDMEGSGIGLSRCKKIVELHSGKIWAKSILGQGSTFHFTLPTNY